MKFHYTAQDVNGRKVEGDLDVGASSEVLVFLAQHGWSPIAVTQSTDRSSGVTRSFFGGGITLTDQVFLTRYLSLMLRVGSDLLRVIEVLLDDFDKPVLRAFLNELRDTLQKGQPLYSTFAKYPLYFSAVFINLVKAGELSGNLELVFRNLSVSLDRDRNFRSRLFSALIYPAFLLGVALLIVIFLVIFALPRISGVFEASHFTPPLFSRVVFAIGGFLNHYIIFFAILFLVGASAIFYFLEYTLAGKLFMARLIARVPVASSVYKNVALQQFTSTAAALLRAGLPVLDVLRITGDVLTFPGMRDALYRVANDGVSRGLTLGAAFRRELLFPSVVTSLIAVSEKAGHIDEVLSTLSDFYETEVDVALKRLLSFVEPVMLLVIGVVVGVIALSIILPMYQLVAQI